MEWPPGASVNQSYIFIVCHSCRVFFVNKNNNRSRPTIGGFGFLAYDTLKYFRNEVLCCVLVPHIPGRYYFSTCLWMPRMNVAISRTHGPCCRKFRFFMSTKVYPYLLIARFGKRQSPLEWGYNPMHTPPTDRVEKNTTADRGGDEHATHPRRSNPPTPHAWQKHKRNSLLHETITPRATSWFYSMIRSRVSTSRWNLQYLHEILL